ncbi:MAG: DUF5694 domain-containing protein [Pseudohongiellaceae bacterium]
MKKITLLVTLQCYLALSAITAVAQESNSAQIMLIGVFHFDNPGLDAVKTEQINVMTEDSQRYLEQLTDQLADYSPTHILLECLPESSADYTQQLQAYLEGDLELEPRESHQLGFRIAKKAKLTALHCFDNRSVEWKVEPMMQHLSENEPVLFNKFNSTISSITAEIELLHETLSLEELMIKHNSDEFDALNKGIYLATNAAGAGDGFEGADAAASWWQRNFRMYANVQAIAEPGTRLIVIAGQGHTAIIKDLLNLDEDRTAVEATPYLRTR